MRHTHTPEQGELGSISRAVELLSSGFTESERELIQWAVESYWQVRGHETAYPDSVLVASQLKTLNTDAQTLVAALLGSEELESVVSIDDIRRRCDSTQANLTDNVRRLNSMSVSESVGTNTETATRQTELLRRMLLAMVTDVRAVLVKLAFRTQRLRKLAKTDSEIARRVASESLEIYAPLANRLGVGQLKWEMEDLAFRIIQPDSYKRIANALEENRAAREQYIRDFVSECDAQLSAARFSSAEVFGRPKHIYSIWKKMRNKRIEFEDLFDVRAVRVLVDDLRDCYGVLGQVHSLWQPVPREFDDYIANPKENGYQSLHTAVMGPGGKAVEVQIRTRDMDRDAELGVAAHWQYKEGAKSDARMHESVASLRQLLEQTDDESLVEGFSQQFDADRVYVFTPKGDVVDLVAGSTPLDFAYHVHSEIGHRCRGAKINGRIVQLTTKLTNGDRVEVLTTREAAPSRDWLNKSLGYLHTSRARSKVRVWFHAQDYEQHVADGRAILDREIKRLHATDVSLEKISTGLKFEKTVDLCVALGRNEVTPSQVASTITALQPARLDPSRAKRRSNSHGQADGDVSVRGVGSLLTQIANCCQPVPYDSIVGFITRGKGVSIHRSDCKNILCLRSEEQERLIEVEWGNESTASYQVEIHIVAYDRTGLLRDISTVMANEKIDVVAVNTFSNPEDQTAEMKIRVAVENIEVLSGLMDKIRQLRNILSVVRAV